MTQLYLDFNTANSTEDPPCTVKVDSVTHAKSVLHYIGVSIIDYAEVYEFAHGYLRSVATMEELLKKPWE